MPERTELSEFATDSEIYDLIMASKSKLGDRVLSKLACTRGMFLSPDDTRAEVADYLSSSLRDFDSILAMVGHTASFSRAEKTTTVIVQGVQGQGALEAFAKSYKKEFGTRENVNARKRGEDKFVMDIEYEVPDHGKTRMLQKTKKDMRVEFAIDGENTVITMPSNPKADMLMGRFESEMKAVGSRPVTVNRFHLSDLNFTERLEWFNRLFKSIDGYKFHDVLHAKIIRDPNLKDAEVAKDKMGSDVDDVKKVTITGQRILAGQVYGSLDKTKFLLSEAHFIVENTNYPWERFKITIAFEEPSEMGGFAYRIWYAAREDQGDYSQFVGPTAEDKNRISTLLLNAANSVKESILAKDEDTLTDIVKGKGKKASKGKKSGAQSAKGNSNETTDTG